MVALLMELRFALVTGIKGISSSFFASGLSLNELVRHLQPDPADQDRLLRDHIVGASCAHHLLGGLAQHGEKDLYLATLLRTLRRACRTDAVRVVCTIE